MAMSQTHGTEFSLLRSRLLPPLGATAKDQSELQDVEDEFNEPSPDAKLGVDSGWERGDVGTCQVMGGTGAPEEEDGQPGTPGEGGEETLGRFFFPAVMG